MTMKTDYIVYLFGAYAVLNFIPHIMKFGLRRIWPSEYIDKFFFFRDRYRSTKEKKYILLFVLDVISHIFLIICLICIFFIY